MNIHVPAPTQCAQGLAKASLTPSQQQAFDRALVFSRSSSSLLIEGEAGMGKSMVLRALHAETGGRYLNGEDLLRTHARSAPQDYEQVVYDMIRAALEGADTVYYDNVGDFQAASHAFAYHRPELFDAVFKALYDYVESSGKRLIASTAPGDMVPQPGEMVHYRPITIPLQSLRLADYRHIFAQHFGEAGIAKIDFDKVYTFSRMLSGYALKMVCDLLKVRGLDAPETQDVINVLQEQLLKSNVDVREVEKVDTTNLVGVDAIMEKLDRTILLPLREPELAVELGLEAKHGVLLYGPPGTGKTTIGRALAHRMQGKFFMIDGDFDHQSCNFFDMVKELFEAAERNAPSVIFIDDADVILTDPRLAYFGRYLLTRLDGLMNEASNRICVMMTAMDIRSLPAALLRSGRLEVWLEMKLPDAANRAAIIESYVQRLPIAPPDLDTRTLGEQTEGFTPADLRRLVSDATGHLALDRHLADPVQPLEAYLQRAATALRGQKGLADTAFGKRGGPKFQ